MARLGFPGSTMTMLGHHFDPMLVRAGPSSSSIPCQQPIGWLLEKLSTLESTRLNLHGRTNIPQLLYILVSLGTWDCSSSSTGVGRVIPALTHIG